MKGGVGAEGRRPAPLRLRREKMRYPGRLDAGRALAAELAGLSLGPCVVAGIPRGGVVVAWPIAERLGAPLTALHTRKLASPIAPEVAFGAVDEEGHVVIDYATSVSLGVGDADMVRIKAEVAAEIARRRGLFGSPPLSDYLPGRTVILVDDGLATGLTMQAAVAYAQRHGAEAVIVAVPCASVGAASQVGSLLHREGDRFVCPIVDDAFGAVGAYYVDFPQVRDEDVAELLRSARASPSARLLARA